MSLVNISGRGIKQNAMSCTLHINHYTFIQSWLPFALSLSLTVVWLPVDDLIQSLYLREHIYNKFTLCWVPKLKKLIQQSQNDIVLIATILTAIQLIQQSWNDIVSISNRYRIDIDSNTAYLTIRKQYHIDIDDIDSNTADPTIMKRYRVDIDSNTVDPTRTRQCRIDIDDIDINTVDTTGKWWYRIDS